MPFVYRLQKILNFRIQKRDEQIQIVKIAMEAVLKAKRKIEENNKNIGLIRHNMRTAAHTMMESYDNYLKHLYELGEQLEEEKQTAEEKLREEQEILTKLEQDVKVLEKHREKAKENYLDEERKAEMKRLDEVAGLKHYAKTQERLAEEEIDELTGIELDEY
jgi:flagellar FliJ protein